MYYTYIYSGNMICFITKSVVGQVALGQSSGISCNIQNMV